MDPDIQAMLPWLIPLVALSLGLTIWAIVDLFSSGRTVRGGVKWIWLIVILLSSPLGPLIYFLIGRSDD